MHPDDAIVTEALRRVGYEVASVWDLVNTRERYPDAVPVLWKVFGSVQDLGVKEGIVRALTVVEARGGEQALLDEFEFVVGPSPRVDHYKWAVANAVSVIATPAAVDRVLRIVRDRRHGMARQMLVSWLGKARDPRTEGVLIEVLAEESLVGQAVGALGAVGTAGARPHLERLRAHEKAWVRKAVVKALARIEKRESRRRQKS